MRAFLILTASLLAACHFESFEATPVKSQEDWKDHIRCARDEAQMTWLYNYCREQYAFEQAGNGRVYEPKELILCRYDFGHEIRMPEAFCRAEGGSVSDN